MRYVLVAVLCVVCMSLTESRPFHHRRRGQNTGNGVDNGGNVTRGTGRPQPQQESPQDRDVDTTSGRNETEDFDALLGRNETEDVDAAFGRNETEGLEQEHSETSMEKTGEKGVDKLESEGERDKSDENSSVEKDVSKEHSEEHKRFHGRGHRSQGNDGGKPTRRGRKERKGPKRRN